MRVTTVLTFAVIVAASGCSTSPADQPDSPEQAVRDHLEASEQGDVAALRRRACGGLADQISARSDDQIRKAFQRYYDPEPDKFSASAPTGDSVTVLGFYTGITDLDIAFVTEQHDRWQVCEIRKGNGIFGPLPGPFE